MSLMIVNPYRFAPAIPLWTPASLTVPPKIWLNDTSSVTGVTTCQQWDDISGNAYNVSQATAGNRPAINATGLDGKRTIQGDGSDDALTSAAAGAKALFQNTAAGWLMVVTKCADSSAVLRSLFWASTNSATVARFNICTSTTSGQRRPAMRVRRLDADAIATLNASAALDTNPHVLLFTMDWSAGDGTIYIDGAQDAQNLSLTTSGNTSNTAASDPVAIFNVAAGGNPSASDSAEIFGGSGSLPSATEIDKLFGYAHHKWGLESLLPALHPYKTTPP